MAMWWWLAAIAIGAVVNLSQFTHASEEHSFSCWKVCGLLAKRNGFSTMNVTEQHSCCSRVHMFEYKLHESSLLSVTKGLVQTTRVAPAVAPPRGKTADALQPNMDDLMEPPSEDSIRVKPLPPSPSPAPSFLVKGNTEIDNDMHYAAGDLDKEVALRFASTTRSSSKTPSVSPTPSFSAFPSTTPSPSSSINSIPQEWFSSSPSVSVVPEPSQQPKAETLTTVQVIPDLSFAEDNFEFASDPLQSATPKVLLVAVATAPSHVSQRNAIRQSWKKYLDSTSTLLSQYQRTETDILFFIGRVHGDNSTHHQMLERDIRAETAQYHDIVRSHAFFESYSNLTLKTVSMLRFAKQREYTAMFKTDDDSFIRLDLLWRSMDLFSHLSSAYLAHCSFDFPVNQDPESKNFMYDTFPHDTIPVLCHGGGYLIGRRLIDYVVENADHLKFHRNEDVAMSLWLAGQDSQAPKLYLNPDLPVTFFWEECNPESVYLNPMREEDQLRVWENVNGPTHDTCAHDFQLREFLDMLNELSKQEANAGM